MLLPGSMFPGSRSWYPSERIMRHAQITQSERSSEEREEVSLPKTL